MHACYSTSFCTSCRFPLQLLKSCFHFKKREMFLSKSQAHLDTTDTHKKTGRSVLVIAKKPTNQLMVEIPDKNHMG